MTQLDHKPTVLTYVAVLSEVMFWTVTYWLVGTLPEENHAKKGCAWSRVGAYRWAAWHFRKYLKHSDDSWGRASLAWCYQNLGLPESAVQHYRIAYSKARRADIACCLADAELSAGNVMAARKLAADLRSRREELSPELTSTFAELEEQLSGIELIEDGERDTEAVPSGSEFDTVARKVRRLTPALLWAAATFAGVLFVLNLRFLLSWWRTAPADYINLFVSALAWAVVFSLGLLVVYVPAIKLVQYLYGRTLSRRQAALMGVALVPGPAAIILAVTYDAGRDPTTITRWAETVMGSPGEFLLWLLPFCFGGVVFAVRFAAPTPSEEPRGSAR